MGIAIHQLKINKPHELDLEKVKSNGIDEQAKNLISSQFKL